MKAKFVFENISFERGAKDPKRSIGIGKLSTRIFNALDKGIKEQGGEDLSVSEVSERNWEDIKDYGGTAPNVDNIVHVWWHPEKERKFILYGEIISENEQWGLEGLKKEIFILGFL